MRLTVEGYKRCGSKQVVNGAIRRDPTPALTD